jgi:transcriptional regulator
VYVPRSNRIDEPEAIWRFVAANSFALLASQVAGRLWATHIPILSGTRPDGTRYLHGHIARANPQWRDWREGDEALAVFSGPHAYISSSWYDHPNVPTWNYLAVHVYGRLRLIEGDALRGSVGALLDKYEAHSRQPVTMEGLPDDLVQRELRAIVGFELDVTEVHGKQKLSQNRDDHNRDLIIEQLDQRHELFDAEIADEMRRRRK